MRAYADDGGAAAAPEVSFAAMAGVAVADLAERLPDGARALSGEVADGSHLVLVRARARPPFTLDVTLRAAAGASCAKISKREK